MIDALPRQGLREFLATVAGAFGLRGRRFRSGFGWRSRFFGRVESIEEGRPGDRLRTGTLESLQEQVQPMVKLFIFAMGFLQRREQFLNHPLEHQRIIGKDRKSEKWAPCD